MNKISMLRSIVNNGWTIANRRTVCSQIGKSNFEEIANLAKQKGMTGDVFEYQMVKDELLPTKLADTKSLLSEPSLNVKKWGRELRERVRWRTDISSIIRKND